MAEPEFIPKAGQVDYSNIRYCPVVNTIVTYNDEILLVQRSGELRLYPGYWNGISGFLDDQKSIEEKVHEELSEELGVSADQIVSVERGAVLLQEAPEYRKTWLVVPVLARVSTREFQLDFEAQTAEWIKPQVARKLNLLPGFAEVLDTFF